MGTNAWTLKHRCIDRPRSWSSPRTIGCAAALARTAEPPVRAGLSHHRHDSPAHAAAAIEDLHSLGRGSRARARRRRLTDRRTTRASSRRRVAAFPTCDAASSSSGGRGRIARPPQRGARAHVARADRLLRGAAGALGGRVVPPRDDRLPPRVGVLQRQAMARLHRDRRPLPAPDARTAAAAGARRSRADHLDPELARGDGAAGGLGRRLRRRAARADGERQSCSSIPTTPSSRAPTAWTRRCPKTPVELAIVGRRTGGSRGGGVRGIRGPGHTRARRRVDRRAGRIELADPQLPRLLAGCLGLRARSARVPAGMDVRCAIRPHAPRDRHEPRRRRLRTARRRRRGRPLAGGGARVGASATDGWPRRACGGSSGRRCSTAPRRSRPGRRRGAPCSSSAEATPPGRPRCTSPATRGRYRSSSAVRRSPRACLAT